MKNKIVLLFLSMTFLCFSQEKDSLLIPFDSIAIDFPGIDSLSIVYEDNNFKNENAILPFYEKLYQLEQTKNGKINIVHIGDSHIQADLFTAKIRSQLQDVYGNAGFGFTFPYSVANTNNSAPIRYSASGNFQCSRLLSADSSKKIGLSGISMDTNSDNFAIQLTVKDPKYFFTKCKIITPGNKNIFDVSVANRNIVIEKKIPKKIKHKIKSGEVLSTIADKYNVSIKELKKANGLKSDLIRKGKTLKIPTNDTQSKITTKTTYIPEDLIELPFCFEYNASNLLEKIAIVPNQNCNSFSLNGVVLENNAPGLIYHSIGINGAKTNDFNKFPMFFEQLPALNPDLIIISLGTNESFDKQSAEQYNRNLQQMIQNIKQNNANVSILVMTSPPSVLHRRFTNTFIESYAQIIKEKSVENDYAVWNLYQILGGNKAIIKNAAKGFMARDKVHYSKTGYEFQAELFFDAFLQSYELYKSTK